jgi:peptidoglycan/xylan/chitin deacetylase (PgdA/CDA1 family)
VPEEKPLCLTVDLENDWNFPDPSLDHLVLDHVGDFIRLIREIDVPVSIFIVGRTLEEYPAEIDRLESALDCEFHLHSYQHDLSKSYDFETEVRRGVRAFRDHFDRRPAGYRAPQGNIDPHEFPILEELGFAFDSSVFPSYRPGKYNNLTAPLEPYTPDTASSLLEIPVGAFRGLRVPLSHSYFKLVGRPLAAYLSVAPLPDVLVYNVHLHDLYRTASHDELDDPKRWIMKRNLDRSESLLRENVSTVRSRGYVPTTMTAVHERFEEQEADDNPLRCRRGENQERGHR